MMMHHAEPIAWGPRRWRRGLSIPGTAVASGWMAEPSTDSLSMVETPTQSTASESTRIRPLEQLHRLVRLIHDEEQITAEVRDLERQLEAVRAQGRLPGSNPVLLNTTLLRLRQHHADAVRRLQACRQEVLRARGGSGVSARSSPDVVGSPPTSHRS